jgi:hypothetical protein
MFLMITVEMIGIAFLKTNGLFKTLVSSDFWSLFVFDISRVQIKSDAGLIKNKV